MTSESLKQRDASANLQPGDDRQTGMHLGEKRLDIRIGDWKRPCFMHVSIARIHDVRVEAPPVGVCELAQSNNGVVVQGEQILPKALGRLAPRRAAAMVADEGGQSGIKRPRAV